MGPRSLSGTSHYFRFLPFETYIISGGPNIRSSLLEKNGERICLGVLIYAELRGNVGSFKPVYSLHIVEAPIYMIHQPRNYIAFLISPLK